MYASSEDMTVLKKRGAKGCEKREDCFKTISEPASLSIRSQFSWC